ncbi:MAG: biotin--protein ligase [Gammaproteobacteria bacterium]|nr:biotin--protein ligase [Gammaproteobacteria bacterium]
MHGEYKMPGGKLIVADLVVRDGRLAGVSISGDFFLEPDTALGIIDRALEGLPASADKEKMTAALNEALGEGVSMFGISTEAVAVAVERALEDRS